MKKIKRTGACLAALIMIFVAVIPGVSALQEEAAYYSYRYDIWDSAVETAQSYLPKQTANGISEDNKPLKLPTALTTTSDDQVYVLDSGNNRVLMLNENLETTKVLLPTDEQGNALAMQDPVQIYINEKLKKILICDKAIGVYVFDMNLKLTNRLATTDSPILPKGFLYAPVQVLMDSAGLYYVISENCYQGALQFNERGEFIGFFGSEKVVLTADTMINYFWKQILSDEQTANMKRLVPTEFVSFCIDQNDFIYTIRKGNDIKSGQVKKLNARGDNIMPDKFFGDRGTQSALTAITVDKSGFITILDSGSGRLFQYDMDGNMLYAFGGRGNQAGLTQEPVDIASIGEDILVLDKQAGLITKMQPTGFAKDIRAASALCADGRYTDAMSHWQGVLKQDGSYDLANKGLGKAYEGMGEFSKASQCYKKAQEKVLYSEAFSETRGEWLREYFVFFMLGLTAVIILPIGIIVYRRKRVKSIYELKLSKTRYPLYCLTHPFIGYEDMKERKGDDIRVGSVIILLFFVITVMNKQLTGFAFNNNRTDQFSLPFTFISSVGVFAAFVICNWSITTIMDGKGRLKEIFNYCAYALVPYIIGTAVLIALSYALTSSEAAFMQIGQAIVLVWTGISMLTALKEVHMYSMGKTVLTVLMTIAGLIVVLIICAISYNVVTQFIEFIGNIITEVCAL